MQELRHALGAGILPVMALVENIEKSAFCIASDQPAKSVGVLFGRERQDAGATVHYDWRSHAVCGKAWPIRCESGSSN